MNQSALVGGALLTGFVLFIAARDRLTVYGDVLWGERAAPVTSVTGATTTTPKPGAANTAGTTTGSSGSGTPSIGELLNPFDWNLGDGLNLPSIPAIPDLGHMGF